MGPTVELPFGISLTLHVTPPGPETLAVKTCSPPAGTLTVLGEMFTTMFAGGVAGDEFVLPQAHSMSALTNKVARQNRGTLPGRLTHRGRERRRNPTREPPGLKKISIRPRQGKRCTKANQLSKPASGNRSGHTRPWKSWTKVYCENQLARVERHRGLVQSTVDSPRLVGRRPLDCSTMER
jgi:hypothetical protein